MPSAGSFKYAHPERTSYEDKEKCKVELRLSATFYNPEIRTFYGKTSIPSTIPLITKKTDYTRYGVAQDTIVEFYFFAERVTS